MRLMIVDDHASTREMIRKFLNLPGLTFCECASGEEALAQAREFQPNWITLDVNMPGLDGFQTAEALRAEHPSAHIIIVTGFNEPHFRQLSSAVGAVGLICKENLAALHLMLSNEMSRPALAASQENLNPRPMPNSSPPSKRNILFVDDDDELRTLMSLMLSGEGYTVSQAPNGQQAISLYRSNPCDLVITELTVAGRDSFQTILELRRQPVPPKFIATARIGWMPPDICLRMAEHLGAHRVLAKPYKPEHLIDAVRSALK